MELLVSPLRLFVLTLMAALLLGCSGVNKEGRSMRATGPNSGVVGDGNHSGGNGQQAGFQEKCASGSSAVGFVYDNGQFGSNFQEQVKAFVSATLPPDQLGTVSGTPGASTGIDLRLRINRQNVQASRIQLMIYDSYVGEIDSNGMQIAPYPVTINQAVNGSVQNGVINLTFADNYGSVTIEGRWTDREVTGTIRFQNTTHVLGGTPASGVLGSFIIPTCGVFD